MHYKADMLDQFDKSKVQQAKANFLHGDKKAVF